MFSVEKHLKIDKLLGSVYLSTKARPIKVINNSAPSNNMRAEEIAIETTKPGKVTAVVTVISIFCRKKCKLQSANLGNEKPSCQKVESANILMKIPANQATFLRKLEKTKYQRN